MIVIVNCLCPNEPSFVISYDYLLLTTIEAAGVTSKTEDARSVHTKSDHLLVDKVSHKLTLLPIIELVLILGAQITNDLP